MSTPTDSTDAPAITLSINGSPIEVAAGTSVLEASRKAGYELPTLCHLEGQPGFSSCMLCTVKDKETGKTFPSCAISAASGMDIETESDELSELRKSLLEMILSDHSGDCEAPCELVCPASVPIPEIIHLLLNDRPSEAATLLRERVPLGGVLERICTAPCEKGCRRAKVDDGVSIRNICRYAADLPYDADAIVLPPPNPALGRVGILGAGPAGLSAAWYLAKAGIAVTVVDEHEHAGGMLRYAVPEEELPRDVLDQEIQLIRSAGVEFDLGKRIGDEISFADWKSGFDAVVLCPGQITDPDKLPTNFKDRTPHPRPLHPDQAADIFSLDMAKAGFKVEKSTGGTSESGVFAAGDASRFLRLAVRAVADGRNVAESVKQFLSKDEVAGPHTMFNCSMGKLNPEQLKEFAKRGTEDGRYQFSENPAEPLDKETILKEAARCMACDCAARHDCGLREHSDTYGAKSNRFKPATPIPYHVDVEHPEIAYDVGKCIRCTICIRLSELKNEPIGLAGMGRGIDKKPGPPTGKTWADALQKEPIDYCNLCPTAALSRKTR